MQHLQSQIKEALWRYFPESNEDHIQYVSDQLTSAVRGYTAMKIAQHQCSCEWNDGSEFCKGFNCGVRLVSGIVRGDLTD